MDVWAPTNRLISHSFLLIYVICSFYCEHIDIYIEMPTQDIPRLKGSIYYKHFKKLKTVLEEGAPFRSPEFWLDAEPKNWVPWP